MTKPELEFDQIQGLALRGYSHPFARYVFFTITNGAGARAWLRKLLAAKSVASSGKWTTKPDTLLNLAFTATGLERLGQTGAVLDTFSEEFRQGMPYRSDILADHGVNAPTEWEIGAPGQPLHGVLILFAMTADGMTAWLKQQQDALLAANAFEILAVEEGYRREDKREHFGFTDGISQPAVLGVREPWEKEGEAIKPGEFVLGYINEYGVMPPAPHPEVLGRNGTYIVYRKLRQHVAAFWEFIRAQADSDHEDAEWVAAKMVGRWRSGVPLGVSPVQDQPELANDKKAMNNFNFTDTDKEGFHTPIGSHIRRANPRDFEGNPDEGASFKTSSRHRIIRRGMSYGPPLQGETDDGRDRGVQFWCVNSNISIQFEFTQQTWINNPKFHGLYNDRDVMSHANDGTSDMLIQREPFRKRVRGMPAFVQVRGGAYFFLPSLPALAYLADDANAGTE